MNAELIKELLVKIKNYSDELTKPSPSQNMHTMTRWGEGYKAGVNYCITEFEKLLSEQSNKI
jgi:hypothetical protein